MHLIRNILTLGIAGLLLVLQGKLQGQISPGPLAEVHAHLEGLANCTKCHTIGSKVTNDKCLDCHTLLKERIREGKGYHVSAEVKGKACYTCHNDHHGRNFQIIRFEEDKFDHRLAGYILEGSHAQAACRDCHKKEFIVSETARGKKFTFLGLSTRCAACHTDYHQGTLSQACEDCHDITKFRPAPRFDHQRTSFPLQGKHLEVQCSECHTSGIRNGKEFTAYADVPHSKCTDCHKDPHEDRFGQNCEDCHSVFSFHAIKGMESFDHRRTAFPLEGKHAKVSCRDCHKGKLTDPLPYKHCTDCHKDYHEGQFTRNGNSPDCSECHDVNGFSPSSYSIDQHAQTIFPLEGAHLATPCFACHKKSEKWQFREIGIACRDCHEDIHAPRISPKYYPDANCLSCHSVNSWMEISFDHGLTDFPLTGAHTKPSCRACHFQATVEGRTTQVFRDLSMACQDCHEDPHYEQFNVDGKSDCGTCHEALDWKARLFDHNKTRFPLTGKHKEVACHRCHPKIIRDGITFVQYKFEDIRCENCH